MVRPVPAGRRGSCCTPYSRLQEEIDNVETIAVTANNTANSASQLAQQAMSRNTFNDDVNVNGDLNVYGDIIQQGAAYETHAEHVFSTDDYIVMRDGALVGLAVGDYSGFQVKKYDGTNDGRLVIDKDGTARVGDVGDEQPLLTRNESGNMVDAAPLVWDAAHSKAVSGAFPAPDPGVATINSIAPDASNDFTIEAGSNISITAGTNKITIAASGSAGAWTYRSPDNDWTDIFEAVSATDVKALKDIWLIPGSTVSNTPIFIPKGIKGSPLRLMIDREIVPSNEKHKIRIFDYLTIAVANVTTANNDIGYSCTDMALAIDANLTPTFTRSSNSGTVAKSTFSIYTRD